MWEVEKKQNRNFITFHMGRVRYKAQNAALVQQRQYCKSQTVAHGRERFKCEYYKNPSGIMTKHRNWVWNIWTTSDDKTCHFKYLNVQMWLYYLCLTLSGPQRPNPAVLTQDRNGQIRPYWLRATTAKSG